MANSSKYSDEDINTFLELAQEVGITRAKRELGYPKSWSTAQYWAKNRGVTTAVDEVMQKVKSVDEWYKVEEVITIAQEGMNRIYEELSTNSTLTADDHKKYAEAFVKHYNVWANAQGKATNITEQRDGDSTFETHIQAIIAEEKARTAMKSETKEGVAE